MAMARHLRYERRMRTIWLGLVVLVACGTSKDGPDAAADDGGGDGGQGGICGGFVNRRCLDSEYCDYANNLCGAGDQTGTCQPRPTGCPRLLGPPICGCDGQVRLGECFTYATGTDLNANGTCAVDSTRFVCGYTQCEIATQYCRHARQPSGPDVFACLPLPAACSREVSCTCLAAELCGASCTGEAKGGLTLTCP